ncbi:D-2-hydroxyacid dehydrogenase [Halorarius litoreus]|uniref:D-2-hydroxyacid dehydrogenase n=1 Tax=Halorarius litoreus TaxID=2962676 RepID=UPI0020CF5A5A|nr:D-2-hydroxyacid dehydrogenase [Halorarius litoreus]
MTSILVVHERPAAASAVADALESQCPDATVRTATPDDTAALTDCEVLVTFELTADQLAAAPALRWVHALTAGVDDYDLDALADREILLTNASGVAARPIAEQVVGYLLSFARGIHKGIRMQERGEWDWYGGHELAGSTVGVVGVGAIGSEIARLCDALGTTVLGVKRTPAEVPGVDELFTPDALDTVLARSDYLVLACPLTEETRGLVDADAFARLPSHAVVVNIARGGIVVEDDLVAALDAGELRGAALDVFETEPLPASSPLWDRDDVLITPHNAGSTPHYWTRNAAIVARNLPLFEQGAFDELENRVV